MAGGIGGGWLARGGKLARETRLRECVFIFMPWVCGGVIWGRVAHGMEPSVVWFVGRVGTAGLGRRLVPAVLPLLLWSAVVAVVVVGGAGSAVVVERG